MTLNFKFLEPLEHSKDGLFPELMDKLNTVEIELHCDRCWFFNPTVMDPGKAYRCHGGGCPALQYDEYERKRLYYEAMTYGK